MKHVAEDVKLSKALLVGTSGLKPEDRTLIEGNLDCLKDRLGALGCVLEKRSDHIKTKTNELTAYQVCFVALHIQLKPQLKIHFRIFPTCSHHQASQPKDNNTLNYLLLNIDRVASSPNVFN